MSAGGTVVKRIGTWVAVVGGIAVFALVMGALLVAFGVVTVADNGIINAQGALASDGIIHTQGAIADDGVIHMDGAVADNGIIHAD